MVLSAVSTFLRKEGTTTSTITLNMLELAMATEQLACRKPLRMNWAVVTDDKGQRQLRMNWKLAAQDD
jgi:hypothetical protein